MNYQSMERESAWRSTQRINMQSQTGRSLPSTGYTAINITTQLQYFFAGRLASLNRHKHTPHKIYVSPPAVITRNKSLQRVTYNITGSPGHRLVPHNVGETILGTVSPYRNRAADVGNVKSNETKFRVKKTKTKLFLTVAHSRRLG